MAYYLIGAILVAMYNMAANSSPIQESNDYIQESLEDILKKGQGVSAIIPQSIPVSTEDNNILKIVKNFIGNEGEVKRTLFFCKNGLCKILNNGDLNADANKTNGIINVQRKKLINDSPEEKIKKIQRAKENYVPSFEATYEKDNKEDDSEDYDKVLSNKEKEDLEDHDRILSNKEKEDLEDYDKILSNKEEEDSENNDRIKSMPKLKLDRVYKGHHYVRLHLNTDPFDVTMTTPVLPKILKFKFPKTRVPFTTSWKPRIFYEDTKIRQPETLEEMIRQYQMYPGAGCVYVKGCDGVPIKILKAPKAMALIAKIYREVVEQQQQDGHHDVTFYLQKYEPQQVYIPDDEYQAPKLTTIKTTTVSYTECFMY